MVRRLITLFFLTIPSVTSAQIELILERELLVLVDENVLSVSESELVSTHLLKYGMPNTVNEAWSIKGLSDIASSKLASSTFWSDCVAKSSKKGGFQIRFSIDLGRDYDGDFSKDIMFVSNGVGLRIGPSFNGGFIKNSIGPVSFIIGDYRRHWGAGLLVDRYDPFNSMRYSHELTSASRAFDGALPSSYSSFTRGVATKLNMRSSWFTASAGLQDGEKFSISAAYFKTHSLKSGKFVIGAIGEKLDTSFSSGLSLRLESNSLNFETELKSENSQFLWLARGVLASDNGSFIYCTIDSENKVLAGVQYGERANVIGLEAVMGGELRMVWAKSVELDNKLELRARVRLVEGRPFFDARLNCRSEFISAMAQVQTSFLKQSVQSAIRIAVGRSNKVCVAVMNGCEENVDQRLFQLLPTSKGYRLSLIHI